MLMPMQPVPRSMPEEGQDPRVTEMPNELTTNLDVATVDDAMEMLRRSDMQMFEGFRGYSNLYSKIPAMTEAINYIRDAIRHPKGRIIFSGSGTSGRMAAMMARLNNSRLEKLGHKPSFMYLIAGGEAALLRAQESAEDLSQQAVNELKTLMPPSEEHEGTTGYDYTAPVVFIGLSCGMSATYSGAQAHWLLRQRADNPGVPWSTIILGFNPLGGVRSAPIKGWEISFRDVLADMITLRNFLDEETTTALFKPIIINPVLGPESIAGSTRMKGGSATKIILDVLTIESMNLLEEDRRTQDNVYASSEAVKHTLDMFKQTVEDVYDNGFKKGCTDIARCAGESLRRGGHVYYIGLDIAGVVALIDASECPPTFGAAFDDVLTFMNEGFACLGEAAHASLTRCDGGTAEEVATRVDWTKISLSTFQQYFLPSLKSTDTVVFVGIANDSSISLECLKELKTKTVEALDFVYDLTICNTDARSENPGRSVSLRLHSLGVQLGDFTTTSYGEIALKVALNNISSTAHVMKGCVYQNRMINLAVTNAKLFRRTVQIIHDLSGATDSVAYICLLKAIYKRDHVHDLKDCDISDHIAAAANRKQVVPLALLLAAKNGTIECGAAEKTLLEEPVLRVALSNAFSR
eukprot:gb/GECG01004565.1/.p1 GENE.gb/GECG01004565.1/~~gb/GECG01004565.1/.p1  ORF type:complete len:636 (+),score=77.90 gb/GECG01004565.1/:1-1908(+)